MSGFLQFFRQLLGLPGSTEKGAALYKRVNNVAKDFSRYAEGDRLLIDGRKISIPLRKNVTDLNIVHNEIIGRRATPFFLRLNNGTVSKLEYPSIEQYVALAPRVVTPIYASHAAFIVSVLDLHVQNASPESDSHTPVQPEVEILDAGTGHGSLTLHLARAIAGANPPLPLIDLPPVRSSSNKNESSVSSPKNKELSEAWSNWWATRRAVVHSVEISPTTSIHAEKLIRTFRQGLYWPHIDFYVAKVDEWIDTQLKSKSEAEDGFLSHAILDMPSVHQQIAKTYQALQTGGKLVVFAPSVTQICDCVREIYGQKLPLSMENVIELGEGMTNGRRWDVRLVQPRSRKAASLQVADDVADEKDDTTDDSSVAEDVTEAEETVNTPQLDPVMVCRPRVGDRIIFGGFIGVWTKTSNELGSLEREWKAARQTKSGGTKKKR